MNELLVLALRASSGAHREAARNVLLTVMFLELLAASDHDGPAARVRPRRRGGCVAPAVARGLIRGSGDRAAARAAERGAPSTRAASVQSTMDGIPGSTLTGPFPVGQYAAALKDRLRGFTRVQVFGEVFGFKAGPGEGVVRAAGRQRRAAVLDVARGLRQAQDRGARGRGAGRGGGRVRLLPRVADRVAVVLVLGARGCGSRARAICSPSSTSCASGCTPRGCSRRRRRSRGRGCRSASGS